MIDTFTGQHQFASNFYPVEVQMGGAWYKSVEHAYQAYKTEDLELRKPFYMNPSMTASQAKKLGRTLVVRSFWEIYKLEVMEKLLYQKFFNRELAEDLLATGDHELVEGNYWHDNYWGNCICNKCKNLVGQNHLGKLLMKIRDDLKPFEKGFNIALC